MPIRKNLGPPPPAMSRERLFLTAEFAELRSEIKGAKDEVIEGRRRMEELWMAGIVGSFEGTGGLNEAAKATTNIEVKVQQHCFVNICGTLPCKCI